MTYPGLVEKEAAVLAALEAAAATLPDVRAFRVYSEPTDVVDPPGVVLFPPTFGWEAGPPGPPRSATFTATVCVQGGTGTVSADLYTVLPVVTEAIESVDDALMVSAEPGSYTAGEVDLPAYILRFEVAL